LDFFLFFCSLVFWALGVFWLLIPYSLNSWWWLFSDAFGCFLILVTISFDVQKLLNMMKSLLSSLAFLGNCNFIQK
jgi:hypothetical protein